MIRSILCDFRLHCILILPRRRLRLDLRCWRTLKRRKDIVRFGRHFFSYGDKIHSYLENLIVKRQMHHMCCCPLLSIPFSLSPIMRKLCQYRGQKTKRREQRIWNRTQSLCPPSYAACTPPSSVAPSSLSLVDCFRPVLPIPLWYFMPADIRPLPSLSLCRGEIDSGQEPKKGDEAGDRD